jgi:putative transposase
VVTTDSEHALPVYPNLARGMILTGLDQLWVADITYIRLLAEFVYLAVILDAFSRRVIGWALERTLEEELTLGALRMALQRRKPSPDLVHHSDRGVQYASRDYTALLVEHGARISMSRRGNPYDIFRARVLQHIGTSSAGPSQRAPRESERRDRPGSSLGNL